ncbi:hypothetical protein BaRGS_00001883 [Batillaria attramentaria]|uniref:Uncharacterized protein n=1 Tax=Batillaria attramentaria TaxID=370345 RepID=A0ABD0M5W5_9CAEN
MFWKGIYKYGSLYCNVVEAKVSMPYTHALDTASQILSKPGTSNWSGARCFGRIFVSRTGVGIAMWSRRSLQLSMTYIPVMDTAVRSCKPGDIKGFHPWCSRGVFISTELGVQCC